MPELMLAEETLVPIPAASLAPVQTVEEALARVPYAPATVRSWHTARRAFLAWAEAAGISAYP